MAKKKSAEELEQEKKEKIFSAQKYFIYKISEYFKSQHHTLQDKRHSSLISILNDGLDIQNDINDSNGDKVRLKKSLHSLLRSIEFCYDKKHPLCKYTTRLARDLKLLTKKINSITNKENNKKEENKENNETDKDIKLLSICTSISSLTKKLTPQYLISEYIRILQNNPLSFSETDIVLQSIVSELLYQGYSLQYLEEWYKSMIKDSLEIKDLDEESSKILVQKFEDLAKDPIDYYVILNSWLPNELSKEILENGFLNIQQNYQLVEDTLIVDLKEKDMLTNFSESKHTLIVEIKAYDKYKAIEKASKTLENYLEMYKYNQNHKGNTVINVHCLISINKINWDKGRTDKTDDHVFNQDISDREQADIRDFLNLRNELRNKKVSYSPSMTVLNRSLELIVNSSDISPENRLLNMWSSLEYTLNSYPGKSIINKVLDIIPKVICLYIIKDKMNILWEILTPYKTKKQFKDIAIIKDLFDTCSNGEAGKYDKKSFAEFLSTEEKLVALRDSFSNRILIQREIANIRVLLSLEKTLEIIESTYQSIEHDLTRIYRIRNKIVHSGNDIPYSIDIFTLRLHRYVNSLISTIIHYVKRQPNLTIPEVLSSIHETYEWYINYIQDAKSNKHDKTEIASPHYVYL